MKTTPSFIKVKDFNGNLVDIPKEFDISEKLDGKYCDFDFIEKFNIQERKWQ